MQTVRLTREDGTPVVDHNLWAVTLQAWEYRIVYLVSAQEPETLTGLGAEGWEVVAVLAWPAPFTAKVYLKRPRTTTEEEQVP